MEAYKIKDGLFWTGVLDPDLRVFDIIMETKYGTTYNSYLLIGSEKKALFETSKWAFFDEMKEYIESQTDISSIDYLILNHTEPDHAGSVEKLLEINPGITIVGTGTAIQFLSNIVNTEFNSIIVKENDEISLGDKTLKFMVLPNLHWPDTMYTYCPEIKTLFTCDSFGSHYVEKGIVRSAVTDEEGYADATKYYFDCILGPFRRPFLTNALKRIEGLEIETICPGHGPVLDSHLDQIFAWYEEWCKAPAPRDKKLVVMPYVSAYGYTKMLSDKIKEGVEAAGPIEVKRYDLVFDDTSDLAADMGTADGFLFGTPTILGEALEPIWNLAVSLYPPLYRGKLGSAFGAYGWSGEGVPNIVERLKQAKLKTIDGFRVRFKPGETDLMDAFDFGYLFGCTLLNKKVEKKGAHKLVKCLVCGAIFDATMEVCPVCGVGSDKFVPADEESEYKNNTNNKYLILGGGAAALEAAKAIRLRDKTGGITMISDEKELPYNRPMMTKAMLSDFSNNQAAVEPAEWYEENNISLLLDTKVTAIDPANKEVTCGDMKFVYDKLIYALGAHCFIPPFEGIDTNRVIAIRTTGDARQVKEWLPEVKEAVVIGGGVLGLEAAWALKRGKVDVTVLELAPVLLGRQLDAEGSEMLGKVIEKAGVKYATGVQIKEITSEGVVLGDGTLVPGQLIIVSTGVRGNIEIAKEAGIEIDRSIIVNEKMETNIPDIYACGDCAQFNGINYALWSQSVEEGKVAGANAAGDSAEYETVDGALVFNGMGTSLFSMGDNGKGDIQYKTVEIKDDKRYQYEKLYFANNRLVGAILIGNIDKMVDYTAKIKEHAKYSDVIGG